DIVMQTKTVEGFQLSPQQERLWLLRQSGAGMPSRAICAVGVEGPLDLQTLDRAVEMTINRHEILRTTFQRLEGMMAPLQVVADGGPARIQRYDLQKPSRAAGFADLLAAGYLPDDLDDSTPLYLSLIAVSPDEHVLLVSVTALCADEAGLKNLVFEIG